MMKKFLVAILFFILAISNSAFAENNDVIVFAVEQSKPVAVSLVEKADYVAYAVTVISKQEEPEEELKEIGEARQLLIHEAQKNKTIKIHNGPIYLSSTSNSKTSFSYGFSQATIYLLISLSDIDWDVFKGASEITKFLEKIEPPGKSTYSLSPLKLAVENPDKYRVRLLNMIYEDLNRMKDLIQKKAKFFLTGIENPIMIRQFDYTQVEIFLDYTLSVEISNE